MCVCVCVIFIIAITVYYINISYAHYAGIWGHIFIVTAGALPFI